MANNAKGVVSQQERKRGKEYTPKQKKFLTLFTKAGFKKPQECAKEAGFGGGYWQLISSLKEDIKEISEAMLIGSAPEAALTITDLMVGDKMVPNAQTKLQAAKEVLDRSGVVRNEKIDINHNVTGGIFLLPVKTALPEQVIEGEVIEEGEIK